ncbi:phosphopantetheinyl transferase [Erwinia sp. OLTSP20]|uniref:4'-phosphopantetheinyl transferase family protein n=1 Tax=unclassified Erwinia TaxID=2622719 RepID=UPI000C56CB1A|nr:MULTISPECIES: 4'-phosphopantetheinyl transferase superfamily protein [unclassified Erwinia]PIJ49567.1 phosphopantetheinyl transferase [Erwinia sp. OAMSP11]PIJ72303.1 phosphopantetheinyl transferase [Erwinia sp. OLSSP12]PIJ79386.1 phosphopantetheinyl transferase [Erwinia sp. OLMDSP33]PIJ81662.1 phosphopantetheinyl transferase [Erwinia sp. OLCASP19]PIJ82012.1 phosphopantetheinyl transferase [Erwinia sp. OLMTSP26]
MASHFARCTFSSGALASDRLSPALIAHTERFSEPRRQRYLAARSLLAELMQQLYGFTSLPDVITTSSGRPCFADPQLPDFSFAYAGNMIGVLLADAGCRAGLDMEIIRVRSRQAEEYKAQQLSSAEQAWIHAQQDPTEAATQIWTLRQSVLKLTGEGASGMTSLRLQPGSGRLRSVTLREIQAICDVEPLLVWSCALAPDCDRLRLWEFSAAAGWNELRDIRIHQQDMGPRTLRLTSLPTERTLHF